MKIITSLNDLQVTDIDLPPISAAAQVPEPIVKKKVKVVPIKLDKSKVPVEPEIPDADIPDGFAEHSGPFDYFLNAGFVIYDRSHVLMDRQVVKFSNLSSMWYNHDVCFARMTVKLHATSPDKPGTLVVDRRSMPAIDGFAQLDDSSYWAYTSPDSVAGFSGARYREGKTRLSARDTQDLVSRVSMASLLVSGDATGSSLALWPSFFVKAKEGMPGAVEMYDLEKQKWEWMWELRLVMPIVIGYPCGFTVEEMDTVRILLGRCCQFLGPIYIGMGNFRWPEGADAHPDWIKHKIPMQSFHHKMVEHDLRLDAWSFPCSSNTKMGWQYERDVLNAWVRSKINQMLAVAL